MNLNDLLLNWETDPSEETRSSILKCALEELPKKSAEEAISTRVADFVLGYMLKALLFILGDKRFFEDVSVEKKEYAVCELILNTPLTETELAEALVALKHLLIQEIAEQDGIVNETYYKSIGYVLFYALAKLGPKELRNNYYKWEQIL